MMIPAYLNFKEVPFSEFHVVLALKSGGKLVSFKGSMLRGAIANAVRQFACHQRGEPCSSCQFSSGCAYFKLFEPRPAERGATAQNKYVIHCADERVDYPEGGQLEFKIRLFDEACDYAAYFIKGLLDARRRGFGARRIPFDIVSIEGVGGRSVYDGGDLDLSAAKGVLTMNNCRDLPQRIRIALISPFRTKSKGQFAQDVDGRILARALIERLAGVGMVTHNDAEAWTKARLSDIADGLEITDKNLRWVDHARYSNRQRTQMQLGGLVGEFSVSGPALARVYPLIEVGRIAHIGKATTFGFGGYRMEVKG